MKRVDRNFLIDSFGFVLFVLLASTGIIMHYILPPGSGKSLTIWGLDRHEWGAIHFWIAVGMLTILALHLIVHWSWITGVFARWKTGEWNYRAMLGIVGVLALLVLALAPLISPVQGVKAPQEEHGREQMQPAESSVTSFEIHGNVTLGDIQRETGVPPAYLINQLNLPENTAAETPLRDLKHTYGFDMEFVRQLVKDYSAKGE